MNWLQLGGSLAAILVLAAVAWALRLGRDGHLHSPEKPPMRSRPRWPAST